MKHMNGLIDRFIQHNVAANLLMIMLLLSGLFALNVLNKQFFPNFEEDFISVSVNWVGASPEDIELSITTPIEQALRSVDGLKKMSSTSKQNHASILLEFDKDTNISETLDDVKNRVDSVRNLPDDIEEPPIVKKIARNVPIANLLISAPGTLEELSPIIYNMEHDLLDRGIAKIDITGLPEQEMAIEISRSELSLLKLSLPEIAKRIEAQSQDIPAGTIGRGETSKQIRSLAKQRRPLGFADLVVLSEGRNQVVRLGDIANIKRRAKEDAPLIFYQGKPAVVLTLLRTENADSLKAADILTTWMKTGRDKYPAHIEVIEYNSSWRLLFERIMLLVKNGGSGLLLVLGVLFLFLNTRVAFWVAVGIPTAFLAALFVLFLLGGSINMISLFALIMALGIVVDDAIVVGEAALSHYQSGQGAKEAASSAAYRMLAPVMSSSLTTVAAFLPLMLIGGVIGNILIEIPIVIVCILIASLVESFWVLPGHLHHSLKYHKRDMDGKLRVWLDQKFNQFRGDFFRPLITRALHYRASVLMLAAGILLFAIGLIAHQYVKFVFFSPPEGTVINADVKFNAGTPPQQVERYLELMQTALDETRLLWPEDIVKLVIVRHRALLDEDNGGLEASDNLGSMTLELVSPDARDVDNQTFINAWQEKIPDAPGIESLVIRQQRTGPPGKDIDIQLTGKSADELKSASLMIQEHLRTYPGISNIADDLPYGQQQIIFSLKPEGHTLGLTTASLGQQIRAAFASTRVQIFNDENEDVEVRVMLPKSERYQQNSLISLPIMTSTRETIPLQTVAQLDSRRGFDQLRHTNARLSIHVTATVDTHVNNANQILAKVKPSVLTPLYDQTGIEFSLEGRAAEQRETLGDMLIALPFALIFIYLILAWVFNAYGLPLVVLLTIPFGLAGAVFGHLLMGLDLTILSLFGLFGLSGIVINDAIILITTYKRKHQNDQDFLQGIVDTTCERLRPVLLTSLTTIGGLTPLLFETSMQAQFLIPMATSICFGLAFSTFLVLFVIPVLLSYYEQLRTKGSSLDIRH